MTYGLRFFNVDVYLPIAFAFLSVLYIGILWLIGSILNRIAAAVIAMGGFIRGSIDTQLIRFSFQLLTFFIIGLTLLSLGASLGIPTYSMVTGLGIGGIAIALAGQQALSNLIGTVIILLDRPFKIGDYIVLGNGIQGSVSEIGLRIPAFSLSTGYWSQFQTQKLRTWRSPTRALLFLSLESIYL